MHVGSSERGFFFVCFFFTWGNIRRAGTGMVMQSCVYMGSCACAHVRTSLCATWLLLESIREIQGGILEGTIS